MRNLTVLILALSMGQVAAQTNVSGGIFSDVTWTLANSPYHVMDDLVVFETATLTIEPGVEVRVASTKGIELRNGRLRAVGTAEQPISFSGLNSQWDGFLVRGVLLAWDDTNQVQMEHCRGSQALVFMNLDEANHTPYNFIDCEFTNNQQAFYGASGWFAPGRFNFERCMFQDNDWALGDANFYTVTECTFMENGVAVSGANRVTGCTFLDNELALMPAGLTDGNTFTGNTIAVDGGWNNENNRFTNNTVVGNGIGIRMGTFFDTVQFVGNRICDNTVWNIERVAGAVNTANLAGNCFCTDDADAIESTILHAMDNLALGLVLVDPFIGDPDCAGLVTAVPEATSMEWSIHPNPTADGFTVTLPTEFGTGTLDLFDATGRKVRSVLLTGPTTYADVTDLPNGMLHAVLRNTHGVTTRAVVVMH